MKTTKAMVYESYGIMYDPKADKIYHDTLGWIKPPVKDGNTKVGKQVKTVSMLPGTKEYTVTVNGFTFTEKGTCPCDCNGCYAMTGRYNCDNVIASMAINTWLARHDLDFLTRAIKAYIACDKTEYMRIHAAGDFLSLDYVNAWHEIGTDFPGTTFWTYTKFKRAENAFDDLENVNIVKSVIPGHGFNFGKCKYILDTFNALKEQGERVYICRCGIDKNQHCNDCKGCSANKYVLFIEHSTDYKAEQDLFFETVKNIIESQKSVVR